MAARKMPNAQASTLAAVHRSVDVHDELRRRSVSLLARMRVADAIRTLAIDLCGGDEHLSATDRVWLRQHILGPVNEATDEALAVLVTELTAKLREAPSRMRPAVGVPLVTRTDFE